MPCEARRVFAASRLLPRTSASVLSTDTTVSSDRTRPDWLWPPGRLATRWGTACKPAGEVRKRKPNDTCANIHNKSPKVQIYAAKVILIFKLLGDNHNYTSLPRSSQLRLSMARFLKAPDIARTTRSFPWANSSAIIGRPFSSRTVARIYRPYWGTHR